MRMSEFKIISQDTARQPFSTRTVGVRRVQCPDCDHRFKQGGTGGCFTMAWTPMACPKCGFPYSKLQGLSEKVKKE